jgi:N-acylneuraminate cytidylyltransferase
MTGLVVALVPARSGSKGVPDKNIRPLGGRPLLAWSIAAAARAIAVDRVIVSTDSAEYSEIAAAHGAEVPFLRPAELAADDSLDIDFVLHALDWLTEQGEETRLVIHLRPTTPFRSPAVIDAAVDRFVKDGRATALRSVHEMSTTAYKSMEITDRGILRQLGTGGTDLDRANGPRQGFPSTYLANGYVDVLSTSFIQDTGLLHGDRVLPFITPLALEVDTIDDFDLLEYHLARHPKLADQLFS